MSIVNLKLFNRLNDHIFNVIKVGNTLSYYFCHNNQLNNIRTHEYHINETTCETLIMQNIFT